MPIQVRDTFEPMARPDAVLDPDTHAAPAESLAFYRLADEMERYVRREIAGRSFLIAGHRGAGKTTMVLNAIYEVYQRLEARQDRNRPSRPLIVRLHGPDLFSESAGGEAPAKTKADSEQMLRQVTIALHRAVAEEFANAFEKKLQRSLRGSFLERQELAVQLRVELDGSPEISRLREFWDHAGFLGDGVLFESAPYTGYQELLVLASTAQSYKMVSGKFEQDKKTDTDDATHKDTRTSGLSLNTKEILNPLLGLLAGGLAGVGAAQAGSGGLASALTGSLTALLAIGTLNFTATRERTKATKHEVVFLPDHNIDTLDRMLPLLVQRLRDIGLAPVFVVDELDKLEDLLKRMEHLVRHLKHFVTERAFFCFLTDRDYFEEVGRLSLAEVYPKEHTYFSNRLLVYYRPQDLREYLNNREKGVLRAAPSSPKEDEIACQVLSYILLHRARGHQFDLRRRLTEFQDEAKGTIRYASDRLLNDHSFRFDVLMQVAVEFLLRDGELGERLSSNPDFAHLATDALYYPSRSWEAGRRELDLSRPALVKHLQARSKLGEIPEDTVSLLHGAVQRLVRFLQHPQEFAEELKTKPAGKDVPQEAVDAIWKESLLDGEGEKFEWRYDMYGPELKRQAEAASEIAQVAGPLPGNVRKSIELILHCNAFVHKVSGDSVDLRALAVDYRLLSTTPPWGAVEDAIRRLERWQASGEPYPEHQEDISTVQEYARLLETSAPNLARVFAHAVVLGVLGGKEEGALATGLRSLSSRLGFAALGEKEIAVRLQNLESPRWVAWAPVGTWSQEDENTLEELRKTAGNRVQELRAEAEETRWHLWRQRFTDMFQRAAMQFEPKWADLTAQYEWLPLDLTQMNLHEWSSIVFAAYQRGIPPWVAIPALARLGFGPRALAFTDKIYHNLSSGEREKITSPPEEWYAIVSRHPFRHSAVVVTQGASHIFYNWKPSEKYAGLLVSREEYDQIFHDLNFQDRLTEWKKDLRIDYLLVELDELDVDRAQRFLENRDNILPRHDGLFSVKWICSRSSALHLKGFPDLVVEPTDFDQAMDLVRSPPVTP